MVYAYTTERCIPLSYHNESGEVAEIEIRPSETSSAILDDNLVHWKVPPYGFSYQLWQLACADQDNSEEDVIPSPDGRYAVRVQLLPMPDSLYPGEGISLPSQIELFSPAGIREVLVPYRPSRDPENDLRGFHGIQWSPDSKGIYFMTNDWVTSPAFSIMTWRAAQPAFVQMAG